MRPPPPRDTHHPTAARVRNFSTRRNFNYVSNEYTVKQSAPKQMQVKEKQDFNHLGLSFVLCIQEQPALASSPPHHHHNPNGHHGLAFLPSLPTQTRGFTIPFSLQFGHRFFATNAMLSSSITDADPHFDPPITAALFSASFFCQRSAASMSHG